MAILEIKRWGNSLGVRLPSAIAKAADLHVDQAVSIDVEDGRVVITPTEIVRDGLDERLARFDPARHAGEVMTAENLGAEAW